MLRFGLRQRGLAAHDRSPQIRIGKPEIPLRLDGRYVCSDALSRLGEQRKTSICIAP